MNKHNKLIKKKRGNILEDITQEIRSDVITNRVNLLRTTVNKANEIKFYTDIDNNDFAGSIHYFLGKTTDLSFTTNPNDKSLYRNRYDSPVTEIPVSTIHR